MWLVCVSVCLVLCLYVNQAEVRHGGAVAALLDQSGFVPSLFPGQPQTPSPLSFPDPSVSLPDNRTQVHVFAASLRLLSAPCMCIRKIGYRVKMH